MLHHGFSIDPEAKTLVLGRRSREALRAGTLIPKMEQALQKGQNLLILDVGPFDLVPVDEKDLGNLQGGRVVPDPQQEELPLPFGASAVFREMPEPESCIHPTEEGLELWKNIHKENTRLWNGSRGGVIVPASSMEVKGMAPEALLKSWVERGADAAEIRSGECTVLELGGLYAFREDEAVIADLRQRVRFLVDDAPALAGRIDPNGVPRRIPLGELYQESSGQASDITSLALCGKDLRQSPLQSIAFGPGRGRVILSQLITSGRLKATVPHPHDVEDHPRWSLKPDPAAAHLLLGMVEWLEAPGKL